MKVACLNKISPIGMNEFTKQYSIIEEVEKSNLILVRSASMHELDIPKSLIAVARAGAGVNNIPLDKMADAGVVVFNTPGANANAVKELVLAGMLLASRDVIGGVQYVKDNQEDPEIASKVEKAKAAYAGYEIFGKTIGVIGLGAVGGKVANACVALGLKVIGYDPYLSEEAKNLLSEEVKVTSSLEEIYPVCDFISLHLPLLDSTKYLFNEVVLNQVKPGCIVLNFSRDALVNDDDMEVALNKGFVKRYVTDFPNPKTAKMKGVLAIPHLGASTEESEENCAYMAAHELMDFASLGKIKNSVNYPSIDPGRLDGKSRIVVLHNDEDFTNQFMELLFNKPVTNIVSETKGKRGVTIIDIDEQVPTDCLHKFSEIKHVIKVRKIEK